MMKIWDCSFAEPEANLAADEALLDKLDDSPGPEVLRFWSTKTPFVVLGYSNAHQTEVRWEVCQKDKVPVLRRPSGGGTVLQSSGCLNYSLVLDLRLRPELAGIQDTNRFIMEHHRLALSQNLGQAIQVRGTTDLTIGDLKFSGNAQRRKKNAVLFHGTFLLEADLRLIERYLSMPSKEPAYRQGRSHVKFVTNLEVPDSTIKKCLSTLWGASGPLADPPENRLENLLRDRYRRDDWNFKF